MTDHSHSAHDSASLPDDLPPVQPPSAGFIVQLFVVPALIVLAVVAVWAMFGRIAAGEQDWHLLVQELESPNPHVHRRAMFGLAQLLDTDRRLEQDGQHLASNPEIATALTKLLEKQLQSPNADEETLSSQVYLTRAMGLIDLPEAAIPVLSKALDDQYDIEVRKGAVTSIALIAGRAMERGTPVSGPVADALIDLSQDSDPTLKRAAAFALGLVDSPEAKDRLQVLLQDTGDPMTAINAAIALSRSDSTAGYHVFVSALTASKPQKSAEAEQDRLLILKNTLKAVGDLAAKFTPEQRAELLKLVIQLAEEDAETRVRVDARAAEAALSAVN